MANRYRIRADVLAQEMKRAGVQNYLKLFERCGISMTTISNCIHQGCMLKTIAAIGIDGLGMADWKALLYPADRTSLDSPGIPKDAQAIPLCMFHRMATDVTEKYYAGALSSGGRVLYISIMADNSFVLVQKYLTVDTKLDVLTWTPATRKEIIGFARIESGTFPKSPAARAAKIKQPYNALKTWLKLASEHRNITVYTYPSAPTLQGVIVPNRWVLIELLPYGVSYKDRPALLLRYDVPAEKEAFIFFAKSFEKLLDFLRQDIEAPHRDESNRECSITLLHADELWHKGTLEGGIEGILPALDPLAVVLHDDGGGVAQDGGDSSTLLHFDRRSAASVCRKR